MMVFNNLQKLVSHVIGSMDTFDTLTIDLFDTLVIRRVHDPDQVKLPVAVRISAIAAREGITVDPLDVLRIRGEAESENRKDAVALHPDAEACYPEFMEKTLRNIFSDKYSESVFSEVRDFELEMEFAMIVPREPLADMLAKLKEAKKTVVVVSDIYLPAEYLKKILETAGLLKHVDLVYSSADTRKAKVSGAAYKYLADTYGYKQDRWLHVGDNAISDGANAERAGVKAVLIADAEEYFRKGLLSKYAGSASRPFWRGRYIQQIMQPLEAENSSRSPLYVNGYNFFGFLLSSFIWGIGEQVRELKIRKVYFFSREGYLLMKIWNALAPHMFQGDELPEVHYLRVSRLAVMHTSCAHDDMGLEKAMIAFMPSNNLDFTDFCRVFGLDVSGFSDLLEKHSLTSDDVISSIQQGFKQENMDNFKRLLEDGDFQDRLRGQCVSSNRALHKYLEDEGLLGEKDVALVDIGWLGTIHRFLFESIAHLENKPCCHGFLMAADRRYPHPFSEENHIHGVIYDRGRGESASSMVEIARALFEDICQVPSEPGLFGYREKDDTYDLVSDSRIASESGENSQNYFEDLQEGVVDAAERFGAAMAVTNYALDDLRPWLNHLLVSRLAFPSGNELGLLRPPSHPDELNRNSKVSKLLKSRRPPKTLWERSPWLLKILPSIKSYHYARKIAEWVRR